MSKSYNVLFITSSRIGDAVLSTGILHEIITVHPEARIHIACGALVESLFEGVPGLEALYPLRKKKHHKHWFDLWRRVFLTRWDMVVDIRDSAVSRLVFAKERYVFSKQIDKTRHKAEQMAQLMALSSVPAPCLFLTQTQKERAQELLPDGNFILGVGPTANWIGKTWAAENFIRLIEALTAEGAVFPAARVAVFAAPGEEKAAYEVLHSVPEARRIDVIAKTDPGTAAAALARCNFYVGNDSGLMHCAAAAGVPTYGLFGPSYPQIYRPYGAHCAYTRTKETFDELIDFEGYDPKSLTFSLMGSIVMENLRADIEDFWAHLPAECKI